MSKCRVSNHSFIFIWFAGKIVIANEKLIIGKDIQLFYGNFVGIPLCKHPEHSLEYRANGLPWFV